MRMGCGLVGLMFCLMAFLAGCGNKREAELVGQWKIDPAVATQMQSQIPPAMAANPMMANVSQLLNNVSLNLRDDKTYQITLMASSEGTWALDGDTLTLTPKSGASGAAGGGEYKLAVDETNKKMTLQPGGAGVPPGMNVMLVKQG